MTGQACPECGGRRPGCACAYAEMAAAEDYDPLRIRPYVTLDAQEQEGPHGAPGGMPDGMPDGMRDEAGDPPTAQLRAVRAPYGHDMPAHPEGHRPQDHGFAPYGSEGGADATMPLLLGGVGGGDHGGGPGARREPGRRRRGGLVVGVAAAAVVGTAALAAAVLGGGEEPDGRAMVPEVTTSASLNLAVSEEPSPSSATPTPTPSRTASRTPSAPPSSASATPTTASPSASSSPSAPVSEKPVARPTEGAAPSATGGGAPSGPATSAPAPSSAPTSASPTPTRTDAPEGATLSLGDTGPEVEELQIRLRLLWVYLEEPDGVFDEGLRAALIQYQSRFWRLGDPEGVYGPETRRELEHATRREYR